MYKIFLHVLDPPIFDAPFIKLYLLRILEVNLVGKWTDRAQCVGSTKKVKIILKKEKKRYRERNCTHI